MGKKRFIKCPKCERNSLVLNGKLWQCSACGSEFTMDMKETVRWMYLCPCCGSVEYYTDEEPHICKNCGHEEMLRTDLNRFRMNVLSLNRQKMVVDIQRRAFVFDHELFDEKLYEKVLEKEKRIKSIKVEKREKNCFLEPSRCPKCGSLYVETDRKGYSLWSGFLGSGKKTYVCENCGFKWDSRKGQRPVKKNEDMIS